MQHKKTNSRPNQAVWTVFVNCAHWRDSTRAKQNSSDIFPLNLQTIAITIDVVTWRGGGSWGDWQLTDVKQKEVTEHWKSTGTTMTTMWRTYHQCWNQVQSDVSSRCCWQAATTVLQQPKTEDTQRINTMRHLAGNRESVMWLHLTMSLPAALASNVDKVATLVHWALSAILPATSMTTAASSPTPAQKYCAQLALECFLSVGCAPTSETEPSV